MSPRPSVPMLIAMRPRLGLLLALTLTAALSAAGASAGVRPPVSPAQKACVVKKIGKRAFDRLPPDRGRWPKSVLARVKLCFASTPAPTPTPTPTPTPAPSCPASLDGFFRLTPVDLSLVTNVGPPGQVRGGDYKGHGYFRVSTNDAAVVMPAAGTLSEGSRYLEQGEVQYLLHVRIGCGLVLTFDHVLTPSAKVLAAFDGKPEAKPDDSRTYPLGPVSLAEGERVADAVGFRRTGNATVDFGVYDPEKPNAASQQPGFAGDRTTWKDTTALCWYGMFPPADAARIRSLVGVASNEGAQSDVCS